MSPKNEIDEPGRQKSKLMMTNAMTTMTDDDDDEEHGDKRSRARIYPHLEMNLSRDEHTLGIVEISSGGKKYFL